MKQNQAENLKEEVVSADSDLLSLAAHQLRSPLVSIRWFLDMLNNGRGGELTKDQQYLVSSAREVLDHAGQVVEVLLKLSRVESGRTHIKPVPLDVKATIHSVVESLRPFIAEKSLAVNVKIFPEDFLIIQADKEFLWQLLHSLLSNAVKYSLPRGPIEISVDYSGSEVVFAVKDSGIGIPKAEQAKVFKKFFRASNAAKQVPQGSGLGLSFAKSLAESWQGRIWFESEEGKGTVFYFTVPKQGMAARQGQVSLAG